MTAQQDLDREVASWLADQRPPTAPDFLLGAVREGVASTRRRPGWLIVDRWTWRHGAALRTAARMAMLAAVVASLIAVLVVVTGLIGPPRPAPPYGLAHAGRIAMDTADGIVLTNGDGSDRVVMVAKDGSTVSPTWSRDGLHLAFWHRTAPAAGPWSLDVVDTNGGSRATLTSGITLELRENEIRQPSNIAWAPDGIRMAFAADDSDGSSIFVATLGRTGAERLTNPNLNAIDPAWSPEGNLIVFRSALSGTLQVVAPDGSGQRQLSTLVGTSYWPDWAPDGSRIAVAATNATGSLDIYVVSRDGATVRDVSSEPGVELAPSWSPDGKRLAWPRGRADGSGQPRIVVADGDGSNLVVIDVEADWAAPVWAADGSRLYSYGHALSGGFSSILVLDPAGVAPVVRLPAEGNIGNGSWQRRP